MSDMPEHYKRIIRIKPLIEGSPSLMKAFDNCFHDKYRSGFVSNDHGIKKTCGGHRTIYTSLGCVSDLDEDLHLSLKMSGDFLYFAVIAGMNSPIATEIGFLEGYGIENGLGVLGAVIHKDFNIASLLTEDLTFGGRYSVEENRKDYLDVMHNGKLIKTVRSDAKRNYDDIDFLVVEGAKYFRPEALIVV